MKKYNGPKVEACVDVIPYDSITDKILIIKKKEEPLFRFIGGHADVNSTSFEMDGARESLEETDIYIGKMQYIGSTLIDDPRYRKSKNKIKTMLFVAKYMSGIAKPLDDVKGGEVLWICPNDLQCWDTMPEHRILLDMFNLWRVKNDLTTF